VGDLAFELWRKFFENEPKGAVMSGMASHLTLNGNLTEGKPNSSLTSPVKSPRISALTEYNSLDPNPAHPSFEGIPESFLLPDGYPDYLRLILTSRVYEITEETSLTSAVNLSTKLGVRVVLKREDLQPVFSFKIRGAYNKMAHIPEDEKWKGVVACSAGTHPVENNLIQVIMLKELHIQLITYLFRQP